VLDWHQSSTVVAEVLSCRTAVAVAREDPHVVAQDMVFDLAELAVVDIVAEVERAPDQGKTAVAAGCSHFACLHFAYYHFAYTHPAEEGVEGHAVAFAPASWMLVRTLSACEEADSSVGEERWTRSWSGTDPGEGLHRRCWRKRHRVGNSTSFRIHRDGGHWTGLADSLTFYLPTLMRG
jgi:hypothetical protein